MATPLTLINQAPDPVHIPDKDVDNLYIYYLQITSDSVIMEFEDSEVTSISFGIIFYTADDIVHYMDMWDTGELSDNVDTYKFEATLNPEYRNGSTSISDLFNVLKDVPECEISFDFYL